MPDTIRYDELSYIQTGTAYTGALRLQALVIRSWQRGRIVLLPPRSLILDPNSSYTLLLVLVFNPALVIGPCFLNTFVLASEPCEDQFVVRRQKCCEPFDGQLLFELSKVDTLSTWLPATTLPHARELTADVVGSIHGPST